MNTSTPIEEFIRAAGWQAARRVPLQADFSSRRFTRLVQGNGRSAILMQAAPDQKTPQFVVIAGILRDMDLSAPEIYAADTGNGMVLMEDFGDTTFGKLLDGGHEKLPLYLRAAEVLGRVHTLFGVSKYQTYTKARHSGASRNPALNVNHRSWIPAYAGMTHLLCEELSENTSENLPTFTPAVFTSQVELFLDGYLSYKTGRTPTASERESFRAAWLEALAPLENMPQTLMLRDFMPDNLMNLPEREGWRGAGLLDFQDGGIGPIAYDLASLCEEARRGGGRDMLDAVLAHYLKINPVMDVSDLRRACHILAAQRHMRILGIVAQRPEKRAMIPGILGYVEALLQNNELEYVRKWWDEVGAMV